MNLLYIQSDSIGWNKKTWRGSAMVKNLNKSRNLRRPTSIRRERDIKNRKGGKTSDSEGKQRHYRDDFLEKPEY